VIANSEHAHAGLRERKKLETRRALERAAVALAAEHGLEHVTVERIAATAGVSARTFFNYFGSKEEAVIGFDPDEPQRLRAALAARPPGEPPLRALRAVLSARAVEFTAAREEWLARRELIRSEPRLLSANMAAWGAIERALVDGVAARIGQDPERDLYPALVVGAAVAAARVALMRWRSDQRIALERQLGRAFDLLERGLIGPAQGRAGGRRRTP
jgi:AcrR family transcriptional regulator